MQSPCAVIQPWPAQCPVWSDWVLRLLEWVYGVAAWLPHGTGESGPGAAIRARPRGDRSRPINALLGHRLTGDKPPHLAARGSIGPRPGTTMIFYGCVQNLLSALDSVTNKNDPDCWHGTRIVMGGTRIVMGGTRIVMSMTGLYCRTWHLQ